MSEFAQFQQKDPVLESTPVASRAAGRDAMADVFGQASRKGLEIAEQIQKEHSNAMFMNAGAQINSIMNDAKMKSMQSPGQADEIAKNAVKSLQTVAQTSLNSSDRRKLDFLISDNTNKLRYQSAQIDIKQNRIQNLSNFWDAYNQSMPEYSEALYSMDFKKADVLSESILANAKNSVLEGLITENQYANIQKSLIASHERSEQLHNLLLDGDASAQALHTAAIDPLSQQNLDVSQLPANHGTHMMTNHHITTMTQQDIDHDIYSMNISTNTVANISKQTPEQFAKTAQKILGSRQAHGLINSNPAFTDIENRMNLLENKPNLTSKESAELKVYRNHMKDLNAGYFWEVQGHTTLGAQAINEWNHEKDAIEKSVSYELSTSGQIAMREKLMADANNKFIDQGVSIGEASHMDPRLIRPIPREISNQVQSVFELQGDPSQATQAISRLRQRNRGYLASQMKQGRQKEVINAIGLGYDNNMSREFQKALISANKNNMDYSALKVEDRESDATIRTQLANNVSDIIKHISSSGGAEGVNRTNDFITAGLNYVKYRAMQSQDFEISDLNSYVDEFSEEMQNAYNISSRGYGSINLNQINLSNADQDILQSYVYNEAKSNYMGEHAGDIRFEAGWSKQDITVFVDPTNHVVAVDSSGMPLFYAPYSDHLLAAAKHHYKPFEITEDEQLELNNYMNIIKPFYAQGVFGDV